MKSRFKEARRIQQANRAAAVGSLMMGKLESWSDFRHYDIPNIEGLPRRNLKSGIKDVKVRLNREIRQFCSLNFESLSVKILSQLYIEIYRNQGFEMPLHEFQEKYSKIKPSRITGIPRHSTIVISLWGLQFKFPEDFLSKDIVEALVIIKRTDEFYHKLNVNPHSVNIIIRDDISAAVRERTFAARSCLLACFNFVEAVLNGQAWESIQTNQEVSTLSENDKKKLKEGSWSLRKKLEKYPVIFANPSSESIKNLSREFLNKVKPFRDSLVHPSPFNAPGKFGGYDKLAKLYRIDEDEALNASKLTVELVQQLLQFHPNEQNTWPKWFKEFKTRIDNLAS